jgi:bacterioferritin-associated ferredoxin
MRDPESGRLVAPLGVEAKEGHCAGSLASFLRKQESRTTQTSATSRRRGKGGALRSHDWIPDQVREDEENVRDPESGRLVAPLGVGAEEGHCAGSLTSLLRKQESRTTQTSATSRRRGEVGALRSHDWIPDQVREDEENVRDPESGRLVAPLGVGAKGTLHAALRPSCGSRNPGQRRQAPPLGVEAKGTLHAALRLSCESRNPGQRRQAPPLGVEAKEGHCAGSLTSFLRKQESRTTQTSATSLRRGEVGALRSRD